jgi:hypothetical protein
MMSDRAFITLDQTSPQVNKWGFQNNRNKTIPILQNRRNKENRFFKIIEIKLNQNDVNKII